MKKEQISLKNPEETKKIHHKNTNTTPFSLKRIHSLLGVVPLSLFVLYHLVKNGIFMTGNPSLIRFIYALQSFWFFSELFPLLLWGSLIFHGVYGFCLMSKTLYKSQLKYYKNRDNIRFFAQRFSCFFMLCFLIHHLYLAMNYPDSEVAFMMAEAIQNPAIFLLYVLGTISAVFHATNGLVTAAFTWGISTTERSQKIWKILADSLCWIFSLGGIWVLILLRNLGN